MQLLVMLYINLARIFVALYGVFKAHISDVFIEFQLVQKPLVDVVKIVLK